MAQPAYSTNHTPEADDSIQVGRRAAARLRLSIPAQLISIYDTRRCILVNLSQTGAQLALEKPLKVGEQVCLQIADIEPLATVVRSEQGPRGGVNGVQFEPEIEHEDVLFMRKYAERYRDDEKRDLLREVRQWVTGA